MQKLQALNIHDFDRRFMRHLLSHNFCCKQLKRLQHNYPKTSDDILVWRNDVHDKRVDGNDVKSLTFGFLYLKGDWERLYILFDKAMRIFTERVGQK